MSAKRLLLPLLLASLLVGCAGAPHEPDPGDPFEGFNRSMYRFNDALDRAVLKPTAEAYQAVVPSRVDQSITNFFGNLDDVTVLLNDLLQLKGGQAARDVSRITFNTTFGLFGLFDVASTMDLPKHDEDFGQTLGYWGMESGPYLVLPFYGPSTVRDAGGRVVDWYSDPLHHVDDDTTRYALRAVDVVDTRADLLHASRLLDQAALDPYLFMRDAYLQRRRNLVYDGNPPEEETFDPFEEFGPGP